MNRLIRELRPNLRIILGPFLVIVTVVVLSLVAFKNAYPRLKQKISQYTEAKQTELILESKLAALREVSAGILDQTYLAVIAFPEKNPSLYVISGLRVTAKERNLSIKKLSLSDFKTDGDIQSALVNLEFEGQEPSEFLAFLDEIINSLPIKTIKSLELTRDSRLMSQIKAKLQLAVYWAPLPKVLPEITTPLRELSSEQMLILSKIQTLKRPVFDSLSPQPPRDRNAPFN